MSNHSRPSAFGLPLAARAASRMGCGVYARGSRSACAEAEVLGSAWDDVDPSPASPPRPAAGAAQLAARVQRS